MNHLPRHVLLAACQVLAGLTLLPFVASGGWTGTELPVLLCALGWLGLAGITLAVGERLAAGFEWSVYASVGLVLVHSAVTSRPAMQVLDGLELLVLMIVAAFALSAVRVRILLVVAGVLYLVSLTLNPQPLGIWIGPVIIAIVAATTEVVLRLLELVRQVSEHDPLTGALNRAGLRNQAEIVRALAERSGRPTTVVFIDLDGFKPYNDQRGHVAGDRLLSELVSGFRHRLRRSDLVARTGGDEFVLVLPGLGPEQTEAVMARLIRYAPIGFTYGAWQWHPGEEFLDAVHEADRLMFLHKQRLREQAVRARDPH